MAPSLSNLDPSVTQARDTETDMTRSHAAAVQKRCWNCRARKTACDRTQPSCRNCLRRGQECLGYGLKLSWPRKDDTRRSTRGHHYHILPVRTRKLEFVNASTRDVEARDTKIRIEEQPGEYGDRRQLDWPCKTSLNDVNLFTVGTKYCTFADSLFSTCPQVSNLYSLLLKMSLADETAPALAIRHAMAALSFQHLGDRAMSTMHENKSVSALQATVNRLGRGGLVEHTEAFRAMAASLLLNMFETMEYESPPLGWAIFLGGSKSIANLVYTPDTTFTSDFTAIIDWIMYYDTLYRFSLRYWRRKAPKQVHVALQQRIFFSAEFSPMRHQIVPSAGCSLELLDIICHTTSAVFDRSDPRHLSPEHHSTLQSIDHRLQTLHQEYRIQPTIATTSPPDDETANAATLHALRLAELYRIAARLYLARIARGDVRDNPTVVSLVSEAIDLLRAMGRCERSWPLFIIALEARTDDQRRVVLDAFTGLDKRPLWNMSVTKKLVLAAWVKQDLGNDDEGAAERDQLELYYSVVSGVGRMHPPCFT